MVNFMIMDYKKIGQFIAKLRKEKKMTQEKLADLLFVDRTTISKWEQGQNNINTEVLLKIAEIFNVTLNEMIIGEKQTKSNINEINDVTVTIIRKNNKFKKYLFFSLIFILILISSFFVYYFVNNYNSIMVYEIHGENNKFATHDGLLVVSREKAYIQLGDIQNLSDEEIVSTRLYYMKNDKKEVFYEVDDTDVFYTTTYKDSVLQYDDLKYVVSNLYLEIIYDDDNSVHLKLDLKKSYSNNSLFNKNNSSLDQEDINDLDDDIPKYIKENYKFNESDKSYFFEKMENGLLIKYTYFYEINVYVIDELYDDYNVQFVYSYPDITYSKTNDENNIEDEFIYTIEKDKCLTGHCNEELVEYFKNKYLVEINSMND